MESAKSASPVRLAPALAQSVSREERGITRYSNRIQGFAYGGAAALVVIIGLRSVYGRAIPSWVVISGLLLEACLLIMIAAVYYFTPEEKGGGQPSTNSRILDGEKEILSLLRNKVLQGESEIISLLRNDFLGTQKEIVAVLRNEILSGQQEMTSALRNETRARTEHQEQLAAALEKERESRIEQQENLLKALRSTADATQQQSESLTRIDEQITMLLRNEVDNIVQSKVQKIFTDLIRREADERIEKQLKMR